MASISALSAGPGLSGLRGRVAPTGWAPEGSGRHQGRSGRGREGPRVASERRARGSPQGEGTKGPRPTPKDKARAPCPVLLRDPGWRALGSVLAVGRPGQLRDQADTQKAQTLSEPQGPLRPTRGAPSLTAQTGTDATLPPLLSGSAPGRWDGRERARSCSSRVTVSVTSLCVTRSAGVSAAGDPGWRAVRLSKRPPQGEHIPTTCP